MKYTKILTLTTALALAALPLAVQAEDTPPPYTPPTEVSVTFTSPAKNTVVGSIFTITGTLSQTCPLANEIYLSDKVDNSDYNYTPPYEPNAGHGYSIASEPVVNGNNFSYSVDLSKAYWNAWISELSQPSLIQKVPQPGKAEFYITNEYNGYDEPTCFISGILPVTIKYAEPVVPTVAQTPDPIPSPIVEEIHPSPSPSITVKPAANAEVKNSSNEVPGWWVIVAAVLGAGIMGGTEYFRHHRGGKAKTAKK